MRASKFIFFLVLFRTLILLCFMLGPFSLAQAGKVQEVRGLGSARKFCATDLLSDSLGRAVSLIPQDDSRGVTALTTITFPRFKWISKSGTQITKKRLPHVPDKESLSFSSNQPGQEIHAYVDFFNIQNAPLFFVLRPKTVEKGRSSFELNPNLHVATSIYFKVHSEQRGRIDVQFDDRDYRYQFSVEHNGGGVEEFSILVSEIKISRRPPIDDLAARVTISARSKDSKKDLTPYRLTFVGPMVFEKDPRNRIIFENMLASLADIDLTQYSAHHSKGGQAWARKMLLLMINNLFDPAAIQYALEIGSNPSTREAFLRENGMTLKELTEKVSITGKHNGFFSPGGGLMPRRSVPIESGVFAVEHGVYSHLYQLIASTYKLNRKERQDVIFIFDQLIHSSSNSLWQIWDILFDGPGHRLPTAPRFWRDLKDKG